MVEMFYTLIKRSSSGDEHTEMSSGERLGNVWCDILIYISMQVSEKVSVPSLLLDVYKIVT